MKVPLIGHIDFRVTPNFGHFTTTITERLAISFLIRGESG